MKYSPHFFLHLTKLLQFPTIFYFLYFLYFADEQINFQAKNKLRDLI